MKNCTKEVKIVIGGKEWHYQSFFDEDSSELEAIRLYGEDGSFVKEFYDMDSMTRWLLDKASDDQKRAKENMQRIFMERLEQLKGDMSDADFGVKLGMAGNSVYQYLVGRRFPTAVALAQIADRCGVTVDWLIGRRENCDDSD